MASFICGVCLFVLARWLLFDNDTGQQTFQHATIEGGAASASAGTTAHAQVVRHVVQTFGQPADLKNAAAPEPVPLPTPVLTTP